MFNIRTGVVLAAFCAMGVTALAEHLVETAADTEPKSAPLAPALLDAPDFRLTKRIPLEPAETEPQAPWI